EGCRDPLPPRVGQAVDLVDARAADDSDDGRLDGCVRMCAHEGSHNGCGRPAAYVLAERFVSLKRSVARPSGTAGHPAGYALTHSPPGPAMKIAQISPLYESVPPKLYGGTERIVAY